MLASAFLLLLNGAFLSLRLGAGSGSFPRPLPAKEERRCVERWMQGDLEARNTLIEHNLRLVAHIIKKYYTSESEQDDLISIGTVGLIKGVSTYRPDKGVRLATYASRCIENEVLMHFRGNRKSAGDLSLSDSIDTDSDGNSLSLIDVLADEEDMSERVVQTDLCRRLSKLVDDALDEREAEILRLRYGLSGGAALTQRETAKLCGISRSYVSRLEKRRWKNSKEKWKKNNMNTRKIIGIVIMVLLLLLCAVLAFLRFGAAKASDAAALRESLATPAPTAAPDITPEPSPTPEPTAEPTPEPAETESPDGGTEGQAN